MEEKLLRIYDELNQISVKGIDVKHLAISMQLIENLLQDLKNPPETDDSQEK